MAGIAQKELVLTNLGRDSQYAFYAADAGAECALYYDFLTTFDPQTTPTPVANIRCSGTLVDTNNGSPTGSTTAGTLTPRFDTVRNPDNNPMQLKFNQTDSNGQSRCVIVAVVKLDISPNDGQLDSNGTIIDARGYNTPCSDTTSPRRLERAVRLQY